MVAAGAGALHRGRRGGCPRNKLMDGWIADWPRVLDRALELHPLATFFRDGDHGRARKF